MHINHVTYMFQVRLGSRTYRHGAKTLGHERKQKCTYVSEVYTEHIRGKMRYLKPVQGLIQTVAKGGIHPTLLKGCPTLDLGCHLTILSRYDRLY